MKELEAALAQVAANNQAIADAEAEAARQAAQQADQGDDSPPAAQEPTTPSASPTEPSSTDPSDPSTTDPTDPSTSDPTDPSTSDPSDPSSTTLQEGDEDPINHGTFTGYYTADGHPLYLTSAETYYYLEEPNPDGVVSYTGELYPEPPTDP